MELHLIGGSHDGERFEAPVGDVLYIAARMDAPPAYDRDQGSIQLDEYRVKRFRTPGGWRDFLVHTHLTDEEALAIIEARFP